MAKDNIAIDTCPGIDSFEQDKTRELIGECEDIALAFLMGDVNDAREMIKEFPGSIEFFVSTVTKMKWLADGQLRRFFSLT